MFDKSARYYDTFYAWKDYPGECLRLVEFVRAHKTSPGRSLLDVACGTGMHITGLKQHFEVTGVDLDADLLAVAAQRHPDVPLLQADMRDFDLEARFDVVTCLFSSIGYLRTIEDVTRAFQAFAKHLVPGGVALIEPWIFPEQFQPGRIHRVAPEEKDGVSLCRMVASRRDGDDVLLDMHYLIGTPAGVEHLHETHETTMFSKEVLTAALDGVGFDVTWDDEGLIGRGLFVGLKR